MVLLTIDFNNMHQVLRDLYLEMMPLCSDMIGVAKGVAGWVLYSMWRTGSGRPFPGRSLSTCSPAAPLRAGLVHHVLPDNRAGNDQRRHVPRRKRLPYGYGGPDTGRGGTANRT